jgi:nucleotide-binding universal stress UspA family protein
MFQPRFILHPTDYSDCARYAFDVAVELARHHAARLLVLHVAETFGPEQVSFGEFANRPQPAGHMDFLRQHLAQITPPPGTNIEVEHLLAEGDPGTAIHEAVEKYQCDLVVMGTYGRSALSRLLTGSVTQKVSQLVSCAILTVRMPQAAQL